MNPEIDCILVQTDPAFELARAALNDECEGDCKPVAMQKVSIDNIESNNCLSICFGGVYAKHRIIRIQAFARTASSVLRMCMLRSANVCADYSPSIGHYSQIRNSRKMAIENLYLPIFPLSNNKEHAMEYYSHYDMMHPHFMIEHGLLQHQPGEWWHMSSTMLVVWRNFSEVVKFATNLSARDMSGIPDRKGAVYPFGTFESSVNVQCSVHNITNPNHVSLQFLRALCSGPVGAAHILETYKKGLQTQPPQPLMNSFIILQKGFTLSYSKTGF